MSYCVLLLSFYLVSHSFFSFLSPDLALFSLFFLIFPFVFSISVVSLFFSLVYLFSDLSRSYFSPSCFLDAYLLISRCSPYLICFILPYCISLFSVSLCCSFLLALPLFTYVLSCFMFFLTSAACS